MVNVSSDAVRELKKSVESNNAGAIRVLFAGFGWGGPKFQLTLEKSAGDDDLVFDHDGLQIVISKAYDDYYQDLNIDWVNDERGQGFNIFDAMRPGC